MHHLPAESVADERDGPNSLMVIGFLLIMAPIWLEAMDYLWWLMIPGAIIFVLGIIIKVSKGEASPTQALATGLEPVLPTSRGIEFIEKIVSYADNPDTAYLEVAPQPEGTHPVMQGITGREYDQSFGEFDAGYSMDDYARQTNFNEFALDNYDEFAADHGHESAMPIGWRDPVYTWYNEAEEWNNPAAFW